MKVMIAYDGSRSADAAIQDLSRAGLPQEAEALVICVADGSFHSLQTDQIRPHHTTKTWRSKLEEADALGEQAGIQLQSQFPNWKISSEALWGSPAKVIIESCESWHPDILVAGSHGHSGISHFFLGSVCLALVHKAPCSVRVARPGCTSDGNLPIRILIANDGSPEAEAVVRTVAARYWPDNTEARVIAVAQTLVPVTTALEANTFAHETAYSVISQADERMRFRLESVTADSANALRRAGLTATSHVVEGDPRVAIVAAAEQIQADTIFLGARGTGTVERLLLGSVSNHIVTHARCTVEVVRAKSQRGVNGFS